MQIARWVLVVCAAFALCGAGTCATAQQNAPTKPVAKSKAKASSTSSVNAQVEELKKMLAEQAQEIEKLKSGLAAKDAQVEHAEQAAARAEAKAEQVKVATQAFQQAETQNNAAVTKLSDAVTGLRSAQTALDANLTNTTAKIKQELLAPTTLHYKGVTLTPSGFFNGETVWRSHATGGELATPFSSIPYEHADSYGLSETYFSGRQSRLGLLIEGKLKWGTLRAYAEGDFLGVGTTSNDNQSTSYIFRQRMMMAELETNSHWTVSGGQGWSLAAENRKGISTAAASIALPMQIDPNYVTGLVWTRAGNVRVTKSFAKAAVAVSLENPQILYAATLAGNTPYAVLGSAGLSGGLLNQTISGCSPSTSIVSYTNQGSGATSTWVPVYKTVNACTNLANISFNQSPDVLVKTAFDPKWGHLELFGIARFAHETIYPGETTDRQLYGGLYDLNCPKGTTGCAPVVAALTTAGNFNNSILMGGVGGSLRVPVIKDKLSAGAKGLFGPGVGRYGTSSLPDATTNAWGGLEPIHNVSGLLTLEVTPTPRLTWYTYYGGDYAGRSDFQNTGATTLKIASAACFMPTGGTACTTTPSAAQLAAGGTWGAHYTSSAAAVGYGSRLLDNSACLTTAAPGYNGASTGYYPGGSCGAHTRNVQEITSGYWYDLYKGDRGRLRQGLQYGYVVREGWSGLNGVGAKGIENMFFTSLRYFLP